MRSESSRAHSRPGKLFVQWNYDTGFQTLDGSAQLLFARRHYEAGRSPFSMSVIRGIFSPSQSALWVWSP
jgi:hypothetical protein